jgi:alkylation response protein AidB-like acyl-CoA dehydrogenase
MKVDADLLARARAAATLVAPLVTAAEEGRRLPAAAVSALTEAGVFKLLVPRAYGGSETDAATYFAVVAELARVDGSIGWCAMINASCGLMAAFLPDDVARVVYGPDDAVSCGVFAPTGVARPVENGFQVRGRWSFASGCEHSPWRMVGVVREDEVAGGRAPKVYSALLRAEDTAVVDTWTTSGLRGTGSHDLRVDDVFVPSERFFSLLDRPRHHGALYRMPFFGLLAGGIAAVTIGLARGAIDAAIDLAKKKTPLGARRGVAHRELVQLQLAQAEAKVRAARAFLMEATLAAEVEGSTGEVSLKARALLRLAAAHAATESAAAVDLAYAIGGASSIYAQNPLQRYFRDVHVALAHVMIAPVAVTTVGRVLLDLETDTSTL